MKNCTGFIFCTICANVTAEKTITCILSSLLFYSSLYFAGGESQIHTKRILCKSLHTEYQNILIYILKKQVSMIRKYHDQTLQTNPRCHEGEPQSTNSHKTSGRQLKQNNQLSLKLDYQIPIMQVWETGLALAISHL